MAKIAIKKTFKSETETFESAKISILLVKLYEKLSSSSGFT